MLGDVNFTIVLSTICSSQSDSIVQLVPINGSVQYTLPVSHSWTNITIIVENLYGILSHTVNINQTGMLVVESHRLRLLFPSTEACKSFSTNTSKKILIACTYCITTRLDPFQYSYCCEYIPISDQLLLTLTITISW